MTKLNEAIDAASVAYDNQANEGGSHEKAMKAAIQAAVKALVPDERLKKDGEGEYDTGHRLGHGFCRAETLKNAGIE